MRIAIDMQGTQTGSGIRGIGRYTISMAKAIIKKSNGRHEIIIVLNGFFHDTIEPLKKEFKTLLSEYSIKIWYAPGQVNYMDAENDFRRKAAELIREAFFESLKPDIIWIPSLFEGAYDNAVTSIAAFDKSTPVAVTIHDLIPMMFQDFYLNHNLRLREHYFEKIEFLKKASCWLAVSEYTVKEAVRMLELDESRIAVTYEGFDSVFSKREIGKKEELAIKVKFGIKKDFLLHVGIIVDSRKNVDTLLKAFSILPNELRSGLQLVFAGGNPDFVVNRVRALAKETDVSEEELLFTGYVNDDELAALYNLCSLSVVPSWYEGFGLPVLEAMACGTPVICSNVTSLPEVAGNENAMFNPHDVQGILKKITMVITDNGFRESIINDGFKKVEKFSWDGSAEKAVKAFEELNNKHSAVSPADRPVKDLIENRDMLINKLICKISSIYDKDKNFRHNDDLKELTVSIVKSFY